jgi:RNA polymerase sigma-70 factor, ECF subfamily
MHYLPSSSSREDSAARAGHNLTWKFVVLEVSSKLGRHFWQHATVASTSGTGIGYQTGSGPALPIKAERQELVAAVRGGVEEELTDHQRQVFTA